MYPFVPCLHISQQINVGETVEEAQRSDLTHLVVVGVQW
jgi:hypothetical protein